MTPARPLAALLLAASTAALAADPVFTAGGFKAHVAFLADDALEGRGTGTRGYDVAAAYVAAQFVGLGLKPAGEKGGWYQQVTFQERSLVSGKVTIAGPAGTRSWDNATEVLIGASAREKMQDVTAPVVFVGYGIDAPKQGFDDYKGLNVKGKIVAYLSGFPKGTPSEMGAHLGNEKARMAAARGAIGTISLGTIASEKVRPWKTALQYAGVPSLSWVGKDGKAHLDAPGIRAGATLNLPAAEALFAGAPVSLAAVRKQAEAGGKPKGFALKTTVRIERTSEWKTITSPEVAAMLPGSDPRLKDEVVVLMGHLDHLGIKGDKGDTIYNGALDNAAGVATMLEVARAFATGAEKPRRSILFIANTAEEKGLLGADYFAHYPTVPIEKIVGLVDLDMPMLLYPFTDVVAFGADHSTMGPMVARAAGEMGVTLAPDPFPEQGVFTRSDHYMFVKQGVPAVFFATGYGSGGEAKWNEFFAKHYHQPSDDMSLPILWDQGARFAEINYRVTRTIADADQRPLWYKGDFFGDLFAPKQAKAQRPR